jgi:hypothetical protein
VAAKNLLIGESRIMVPSPKVATYDLQPEMSAFGITDKLIPEIENETADFICLNYANTDMVGHTGVFNAVVKAAETVDACVNRVVTAALEHGYTVFLTADHGNADFMINEDGSPNTQHSLNLVPLLCYRQRMERHCEKRQAWRYRSNYINHDGSTCSERNDGKCVNLKLKFKHENFQKDPACFTGHISCIQAFRTAKNTSNNTTKDISKSYVVPDRCKSNPCESL